MDNNSTQALTSETFHEGFGDFALQSTDGPVFYFPRAILQYSSKVFATMFEIGNASSSDKPILIQADAETLDLLLTFLHPGLSNPPIRKIKTLANLLRVATQYEMEPTLDALRGCFATPFDAAEPASLITTEPLLSLVIAYSYDYKDLARVALREVVKCDLGAHLKAGNGFSIPFELLERVYSLRAERITLLTKIVHNLTASAINNGTSSFRQAMLDSQVIVLMALIAAPRFAFVKVWYAKILREGLLNDTQTRERMDKWENEVKLEESKLPEL